MFVMPKDEYVYCTDEKAPHCPIRSEAVFKSSRVTRWRNFNPLAAITSASEKCFEPLTFIAARTYCCVCGFVGADVGGTAWCLVWADAKPESNTSSVKVRVMVVRDCACYKTEVASTK